MIGERIPRQADTWIKIAERRIHGGGLIHRHPLAIWRIEQIVLFVSDRFDHARRRITQAGVQRELSRESKLILDVCSIDPITIILRRIGSRILYVRDLSVQCRCTPLHEARQVRKHPLRRNLKGSPGVFAMPGDGTASLDTVRPRRPDNVIPKRQLVRNQVERQRRHSANCGNNTAGIDHGILPGNSLPGCAHRIEQAGWIIAEKLQRVNSWTRTAFRERRGQCARMRSSVRDSWAAVDICIFVSAGEAGMDKVQQLC